MSCVTHWFRAGRGRCSRTVPWPSVISAVWRMGGRDPEAVVSVTSSRAWPAKNSGSQEFSSGTSGSRDSEVTHRASLRRRV